MEFAIWDWIVNQSGVAMFAAFALYMFWCQQRDGIRREEENSKIHREDKKEMRKVLDTVARSNTELCQLIRELRNDLRKS